MSAFNDTSLLLINDTFSIRSSSQYSVYTLIAFSGCIGKNVCALGVSLKSGHIVVWWEVAQIRELCYIIDTCYSSFEK